jgi:hypothetical protein
MVAMENKKIFEQLAYTVAKKVAAEKDRRHGVILEDIQGKFQVLVEGQEAMESRMDGFDTRLGRIETKVDKLDVRMCDIEVRMEGVETRLEGVETRLGAVETGLLTIGIAQKVDKKEAIALGRRVTKLEQA